MRRMSLSISKEMPVLQVFPLLTHSAIDARSMWLRLVDAGENHVARTLSRGFWQ
jgi:hypothetical protein